MPGRLDVAVNHAVVVEAGIVEDFSFTQTLERIAHSRLTENCKEEP
jgi:hypothetical protein